jgi:acetyl esterase/lipase
MPGAAGIFCAGLTLENGPGFGGDASYVVAPIGEANLPAEPPPPLGKGLPPLEYLQGVDIKDPLAAPANSPALLAKFPPTLFITGTRAFELSSAVYSHGQLVKAGAESDLHVWDGLFHGFFYNPDVPESREAYDVIVKFFDRHLGK